MKQRGAIWIIVLGVIALLGGGLAVLKPSWMHGDSKRAKTSTQTTEALVSATNAQGGAAAAVLVKIGEANGTAPDSKEKSFISAAVPIGLSYLPKPDPEKLLEMEKLKTAFLTGQLELAQTLTVSAYQQAEDAQKATARALAAKRASDAELSQVAAERLGEERTKNIMVVVAVLAVVLYLYVRITFIHPGSLATAINDMRSGTAELNPAIAAIDSALTPLQQTMTKAHAKFQNFIAKVFK